MEEAQSFHRSGSPSLCDEAARPLSIVRRSRADDILHCAQQAGGVRARIPGRIGTKRFGIKLFNGFGTKRFGTKRFGTKPFGIKRFGIKRFGIERPSCSSVASSRGPKPLNY